jgi:putative membrane protein
MATDLQVAVGSWVFPTSLTLIMLFSAAIYLRGWFRLRSSSANVIPAWRAGSFVVGLGLIWIAVGSPLAALDEESLTVHMIQHLLLMTLAPPLILLGAPVMPLLHGLPRKSVQRVIGPLFRWPPLQRLGNALARPAFCWLAATAALIGWHIPAAFTIGLQSETWHVIEHACFLGSGFLFWWPVVQPWPAGPTEPRWSTLLYLFLATLPCDILSGFLVFSERVVYPVYLSTTQQPAFSVLADQECAGALMWTCVTVVYLVPAVILTNRLLSPRSTREDKLAQSELHGSIVDDDTRNLEVA